MDKILFLIFGLLIININRILEPRIAMDTLPDTGGGDMIRQIVYFLIFCFTTYIYLKRKRIPSIGSLIPVPMLILFSWAALSVFWSAVPDIAIRRLVLTLLVAIIIFQISAIVETKVMIARLRQTILILGVISFFVVVFIPLLGIHQENDPEVSIVGNWRGIFYHKNIFGSVLTAGILLTIFDINKMKRRKKYIYLLEAIFLIFLLYMSGSKTSLGITILCGVLMLIMLRFPSHNGGNSYFYKLSFLAISLVFFLIFMVAIQELPNELITDDSFTGRGLIWMGLLSIVEDNFWIGLGFQSVFQIGLDGPLNKTFSGNLFLMNLPHSHNLYIEMLISIGMIGLILFILSIIIHPLFQVSKAGDSNNNVRYMCLSLMLFTWLHGMLEVGVFDRDRIDWVIFIAAFSILQKNLKGNKI